MIREVLCRVGLHDWSDNKGGIQVCLRGECECARTYGLSGLYRRLEWERELYEEWQRYNND